MSQTNMSVTELDRKRKKIQTEHRAVSWDEKKSLADKEAQILSQDIEDLSKWIDMIGTMNKEELKDYVVHRSDELKNLKSNHRKKVKRISKSKSPSSSGIMASIWKFHKEEEEENTLKPDE